MDTITLLGFALFFCMTILFSVLSINLHKFEWGFLASICWWAFAYLNIGLAADALFYSFSYLYTAIGLVFFLYSFKYLFESFQIQKQMREEQEEWEVE